MNPPVSVFLPKKLWRGTITNSEISVIATLRQIGREPSHVSTLIHRNISFKAKKIIFGKNKPNYELALHIQFCPLIRFHIFKELHTVFKFVVSTTELFSSRFLIFLSNALFKLHRYMLYYMNKTNHPISSNSHPSATANKATHNIKVGRGVKMESVKIELKYDKYTWLSL